MTKRNLRTHRIVALFLLACLLFNYPLVALFNVGAKVAGVPVLYAYLLGAWAFIIAAAAVLLESEG